MLIFDIETGPLPDDILLGIMPPFDSDSIGPEPGEFDESSVKLGQLKDPEKVKAKIDAAREKHMADAANYGQRLIDANRNYWEAIRSRAALAAHTCQVVAIGYRNAEGAAVIDHIGTHPECVILQRFWDQYMRMRNAHRKMIGFNSNKFDVPILVRRSWLNCVSVPEDVFTPTGYLNQIFVDLMKIWACGVYGDSISLDLCCRSFGLQGKPDDCTGAMFHELLADPKTHGTAIAYLRNDLEMTANLAAKLGVI